MSTDLDQPATTTSGLDPHLHVLWSHDEVLAGIEALADRLTATFADRPCVNLVPVLTGGLHVAAALSAALERRAPGKWLIAPIFASTYAGDEEVGEPVIEFPARFDNAVDPAAPVVLLDDVLDTGTTIAALVRLMTGRGFPSVHVCVLVDKPSGRATPVEPEFFAFRSPDNAWLVGFGMDSSRHYRGLDAVYVLEGTG